MSESFLGRKPRNVLAWSMTEPFPYVHLWNTKQGTQEARKTKKDKEGRPQGYFCLLYFMCTFPVLLASCLPLFCWDFCLRESSISLTVTNAMPKPALFQNFSCSHFKAYFLLKSGRWCHYWYNFLLLIFPLRWSSPTGHNSHSKKAPWEDFSLDLIEMQEDREAADHLQDYCK